MNILITGRGTSGSFQIRGHQLGEAIGATVLPKAIDIGPFDLAVVVKRPEPDLVRRIHAADVPLVWDIVDAWPQPQGNAWTRDECVAWLRQQVQQIRPAGIVAATEAMAADCAEFGVPVLILPHHARPGQAINPIREQVRTVAYQGGEQYIQQWGRVVAEACARRGLTWLVNPDALDEADILVAVRDQSAYAPRCWKSNVKLANAQGTGTPIICSREAGYLETAAGGVLFVDEPAEFGAALDWLLPQSTRRAYSTSLLASAPSLESIAARYRAWLQALKS